MYGTALVVPCDPSLPTAVLYMSMLGENADTGPLPTDGRNACGTGAFTAPEMAAVVVAGGDGMSSSEPARLCWPMCCSSSSSSPAVAVAVAAAVAVVFVADCGRGCGSECPRERDERACGRDDTTGMCLARFTGCPPSCTGLAVPLSSAS